MITYFYTHIIFSKTLNKYYIGFTNNLNHRLLQHNSKHEGFTAKANDWEVVYHEKFDTKSDAQKREKEIKNWKSRIKIEKLIQSII